jgi:hypothetical protein
MASRSLRVRHLLWAFFRSARFTKCVLVSAVELSMHAHHDLVYLDRPSHVQDHCGGQQIPRWIAYHARFEFIAQVWYKAWCMCKQHHKGYLSLPVKTGTIICTTKRNESKKMQRDEWTSQKPYDLDQEYKRSYSSPVNEWYARTIRREPYWNCIKTTRMPGLVCN